MGGVKFRRVMYEVNEDRVKKTVYLLDEKLHIKAKGKVSSNLTNTTLSHEKIRNIIVVFDNVI